MDIKIFSLSMWTDELNRRFGRSFYVFEKVNSTGDFKVYFTSKSANRLLIGEFDMAKNVGYIYDRRGNVRSANGLATHTQIGHNGRLSCEVYNPGRQLYSRA